MTNAKIPLIEIESQYRQGGLMSTGSDLTWVEGIRTLLRQGAYSEAVARTEQALAELKSNDSTMQAGNRFLA